MSTRRVRRLLVGLVMALALSFSIVPEITLAADGGLAQPDSAAVEKGGGSNGNNNPESKCKKKQDSPDLQCNW